MTIETSKTEKQRDEKRGGKKKNHSTIQELWEKYRKCNIYEVIQGKQREKTCLKQE